MKRSQKWLFTFLFKQTRLTGQQLNSGQRKALSVSFFSRELSLEEIEEFANSALKWKWDFRPRRSLRLILAAAYFQVTSTNVTQTKVLVLTLVVEYKVEKGKEDEAGQIVEEFDPNAAQTIEVQEERPDNTLGLGKPSDEVVLLSEAHRPEEKWRLTKMSTAPIMNSKICVQFNVERLTKMGVHSLKIEGRTKSFYYCARTAQVYRKTIDDAVAGKPFDESLMNTLESLAHRGYTEGFLRRHTHDAYQNYDYGYSVSDAQQFVGEFTGKRRGDMAEVEVKNKFMLGDSLELMTQKVTLYSLLKQWKTVKLKRLMTQKATVTLFISQCLKTWILTTRYWCVTWMLDKILVTQ